MSENELPIFVEIDGNVKEKTKVENATVFDEVVNHYVQQVKKERVDILVKLVDKIKEANKELNKIKPDVKLTGPDGNTLQYFSDNLTKKKKELGEKIDKYNLALSKAVKECDYELAKKLSSSNEPTSQEKKE